MKLSADLNRRLMNASGNFNAAIDISERRGNIYDVYDALYERLSVNFHTRLSQVLWRKLNAPN